MKKKPPYGEAEIEEVLSKARVRNKAKGTYKEHKLTDVDYYTVTLDNGRLLLCTAEIQDRRKLLPDRINDIAARFHEVKVP